MLLNNTYPLHGGDYLGGEAYLSIVSSSIVSTKELMSS